MSAARAMAVFAMIVAAAFAWAGESTFTPQTDPFAKPVIAPPPPAEDDPALALAALPPEPPELPQLRAVLHSSRGTLVNLDGSLVAIGDHYQQFRVAAAGERDVVLLLGDETHVVSLDQGAPRDAHR